MFQEIFDKAKETITNCGDKISNFFSILLAIAFFLLIIELILAVCKGIEKARKKK